MIETTTKVRPAEKRPNLQRDTLEQRPETSFNSQVKTR